MTDEQITKILRYGRNINTAQLKYLGIELKKGWKKQLEEIEISEDDFKTLCELKVRHKTSVPKVNVKYKIVKNVLKEKDLFKGYTYKQAFEELKELVSVYPDVTKDVLRRMSYEHFLTTNYWDVITTYLKHRAKCCKCGSKTDLNVHHLTYENHGDEINHLEDLMVVCRKCHKEIHGIGEQNEETRIKKYKLV